MFIGAALQDWRGFITRTREVNAGLVLRRVPRRGGARAAARATLRFAWADARATFDLALVPDRMCLGSGLRRENFGQDEGRHLSAVAPQFGRKPLRKLPQHTFGLF